MRRAHLPSASSQRMRWSGKVLLGLLVGVSGLLASLVLGIEIGPGGALTTYTVTTTLDNPNSGGPTSTSCVSVGGCSLRAAVSAADANGGGVINLQSDQTYSLVNGTLDLGVNAGEAYVINGAGSTITAQQPASCPGTPSACFGVMSLDTGGAGSEAYTLSNLTISGGEVNSVGGAGVIGGGTGDTYTFTNDTFSQNQILSPAVGGEADGAGLSIGAAATVNVTSCTFSGNTAGTGSNGAGLFVGALDGNAVAASVTNSTFNSNAVNNATGGGGGLYASAGNTASSFTVQNSTFTGNSATNGGGYADGGGAILADGIGTLNAFSDNFTSNSVNGSGQGGAINIDGGTATMAGDIFNGNTAVTTTGGTLSADPDNSPAVNAEDSFWSSNSGPSTNALSDISVTNYLVLRVSASINPVASGTNTTVTADLTNDENDTAYGLHPILDGTSTTFGGTAGTYGGGTTKLTSSGSASNILTAGTAGSYSPDGVSASVDGVTAEASLVVSPAADAPAVTAISPTSGPTTGGTTVTITGTGFTGATKVLFGGVAATSFTVVSDTDITAVSPAQAAATHAIAVTTPGGTSANVKADQFTYVTGVPTVTAIAPSAGPTAGGTTVTVTGTGFTGATKVLFGGVAATSFTVASATKITAVSPAQAAAVHAISVTTPGGTSANVKADQFTYAPAPAVTAISPKSGPTTGGTTVTVTGTGFTGATKVLFGGVAATSFTVVSGTDITAVSPAQAAAVHGIYVTTPGGTSASVTADQFTYVVGVPTVTAISPTSGPTTGGTTVTVTGTNFTGATKVLFGGVAATSFTVVSATQITAVSPAQAAAVHGIYVTTAGGTSAGVTADQFTYVVPAPTVTGISPTSGPSTGGTTVTVTGTGFNGATKVLFGGVAATSFAVTSSGTAIVAVSPAQAAAVHGIYVTTPAGTSASVKADQFTYS